MPPFVLLEIRKKIPFTLRAVHVNHKIRPDASEDADYVRELCKRQGVPFHLVEEDVEGRAKEYGISTEEAGRRIRYRAFGEVLGEKKVKLQLPITATTERKPCCSIYSGVPGLPERGDSSCKRECDTPGTVFEPE